MADTVRPSITSKFLTQLEEFGIKPSKVYRNLSVEELVDSAVKKNEGIVTSTGSLSVKTGKYTGRSPDDRFIVYDDMTHDTVDWGKINHQFPSGKFEKIFEKMKKFVEQKELYVFDGFVGSDKEKIFNTADRLINDDDFYKSMSDATNPYGDGLASKRIADILSQYKEELIKRV